MSDGLRAVLWDNPIIRYEAAPKLLRRLPATAQALIVGGATALLLAGAWWFGDSFPQAASAVGFAGLGLWGGATCLFALGQTAGAVVSERQRRTWDALVLSRLGPAGILLGKLGSALLPLWALGLVLLPAGLLLVMVEAQGEWALWSPLIVLAIYVGTVICSASAAGLGIYCSMTCSTAGTAYLLAFGLLFGIWTVVSVLGMLAMVAVMAAEIAVPDRRGGMGFYWMAQIIEYALMLLPGYLFGVHSIRQFRRLDRINRF